VSLDLGTIQDMQHGRVAGGRPREVATIGQLSTINCFGKKIVWTCLDLFEVVFIGTSV